jgi:hypothetical protein
LGEGEGCVLRLPEGAGVGEFAVTSTEGACESAGEFEDAELGEFELSAFLISLEPTVSLLEPGLLTRHSRKAASAANATRTISSTLKRADPVA